MCLISKSVNSAVRIYDLPTKTLREGIKKVRELSIIWFKGIANNLHIQNQCKTNIKEKQVK